MPPPKKPRKTRPVRMRRRFTVRLPRTAGSRSNVARSRAVTKMTSPIVETKLIPIVPIQERAPVPIQIAAKLCYRTGSTSHLDRL